MIEVILAWTKRLENRGCDFPGFHFIPSGLRFPRAAWILGGLGPVPHRPCLATTEWPRAKQVGRGFWRVVRFQEKCRLDERSVIRQTANRLRYVTFGRLRFASGGSSCHRANLPYGLTIPVPVLVQTDEVIR